MTLGKVIGGFVLVVVLILTVNATAIAQNEGGKIPLTTSSEEAREFFIKGQDLAEKLRGLESREYFEKAVALDSNFALAYMNLAFAQPSTRGFFEYFNRAVELADKASLGERLLILSFQAGNNAETMKQEEYLKELAAAYPNDERAQMALGNFYFGIQDYKSAIDMYLKSTAINPEFSQPYNMMGYSQRALGNFEMAEKGFQKYISLIPDDPNPYDSYAELLLEMGKFEKSIEYYRKALAINPIFFASYLGIATCYNLLGQHQTARNELQAMLKVTVDGGQRRAAYFAEAVSYTDEGNLEAAIQSLRKQYAIAEEIDDNSAMAGDLNLIGFIEMEAGNYDDAMLKFKKSIRIIENSDLSPEIIENGRRQFLLNTARINLAKGEINIAREKAAKYAAMTAGLNNPFQIRQSHELAGTIALAEEKYDQAIEELLQANLQNPYNYYRLALAYRGAGMKDKAREACDKAAHDNTLNSLNYALIRTKAEKLLKTL